MHQVYVLGSTVQTDKIYIGCTQDLVARLQQHNSETCSYSSKYAPWEVLVAINFKSKSRAYSFEKYLKSGNGRIFIRKHFL